MPRLLKSFFIALIGYYLMGRFGLYLAIPPGFASAVWPASGFALACMLTGHPGASALGILTGSFLINLGVASNNFQDIQPVAAATAIGIACGALIQASVGRILWKRYLPTHSILDAPRDILVFILLIAPLGCLTAAMIGPLVLLFSGFVSSENFIFTWFTWWVGDTIGVLLFAPLTITLFEKHSLSVNRKLQIALPTFLLFLSVLILFHYSTKARESSIASEIEERAETLTHHVDESLQNSVTRIMSFRAFLKSTAGYERTSFEEYANAVVSQDKVLKAIGWTQIVSHKQRPKMEEHFKALGFPEFSFTEFSENGNLKKATPRDIYYPVLHITPFTGNEAAFGLDLGANPARLLALTTAHQSGKPVSTEPITLAQETANQKSFILYLPIFKHGSDATNPEDLLGFVSAVYQADTLLGPIILEAKNQNFKINVTDKTDPDNPLPLIIDNTKPLDRNHAVSLPIEFGTRSFVVQIEPENRFKVATKDWASWILLTIGFFVIAMLQAMLLILTGTTERIREEVKTKTADYLRARKQAEDASEAKSAFLANMSHEFRTPLNAIIGFTSLTLKTKINETQRDYLKKSQLASETLLSLISHILDFSRIEAGKLVIEVHEFDLRDLIQKIEAIFSIQAQNKKLNFNVEIAGDLPRFIKSDSLRIEQILLNLCNNAIKFTDHGGVALTFQKQGNKLVIVVADSGIGISEKQQQKLFQPFQQADNSMTRKFGGSGLGLAICREICEQMGGSIELSSDENQGSIFSVTLPLVPVGTALIDSSELTKTFGSPTNNPFKVTSSESLKTLENMHVLVVEDLAINRELVECMLEDYGIGVSVAEDGLQALEYFSSDTHFDAVLMDINMPNMDGFEATQAIRKLPAYRALPIIAMTANVGSTDIQRCFEAGMNAHLAKPLTEENLIQTLAQFQR